ncbi:MAG: M12 family metallo-peptidase [Roseibacillus sp.]
MLYLDFDGEEGPHEGWGDFDAAPFNFANSKIKNIWERVSEDFSPFNLNVTTDLQVFLEAPETSRQRRIITNTKDAAPSAGGVAYGGSFNWSGDTPCWGYLAGTKTCAEVVSHELGHTLDLAHDGRTTPSETYYGGHGSGDTGWAPIMGVSYSKNLTQWAKGEYLNADNAEDDLALITSNNNSASYRLDDHGAIHATATPLGFTPFRRDRRRGPHRE